MTHNLTAGQDGDAGGNGLRAGLAVAAYEAACARHGSDPVAQRTRDRIRGEVLRRYGVDVREPGADAGMRRGEPDSAVAHLDQSDRLYRRADLRRRLAHRLESGLATATR